MAVRGTICEPGRVVDVAGAGYPVESPARRPCA
jgi:hypothetical protein